jgi:CubicO group peptidase (beta-lactamase class C family)
MTGVQGTCDPAFAAVGESFEANFAERSEVGASVCLTLGGRTLVDLWGGVANPRTAQPWTRDTVSVVFSCTKGAAALCAHILAERGALRLHERVGRLWPAFASFGKDATTLAMMLGHTSPVPHLRATIPPGGLADFDTMAALVAAEPAWWEPGTRQGYHALTFAWTVGTMVRLAAGEPLARFFQSEVAGPLGLDFHIGLPEADEARVARLLPAPFEEIDTSSRFAQAAGRPGSLPALFLGNTGGNDYNSRAFREAEIASANGVTNARGLAGLYAPLAAGGGKLLQPETVARMARVTAATQDDAMLMQPMRFGLGFMASMDNREAGGDSVILGESAFGHVGMGGSIGFADPAAGLSFGYTMNRMGAGILLNQRGQSLVDAAYRSLGFAGNASGCWR